MRVLSECLCTTKEMHLGFDRMVLNHHDLKMQSLLAEQPIDKKSKQYKYDKSGAEDSVPLFC